MEPKKLKLYKRRIKKAIIENFTPAYPLEWQGGFSVVATYEYVNEITSSSTQLTHAETVEKVNSQMKQLAQEVKKASPDSKVHLLF